MKDTTLRTALGVIVGTVGVGLVGLTGLSAANAEDDVYGKREDGAAAIVTADDDDDDDPLRNDDTNTNTNTQSKTGPDDTDDTSLRDESAYSPNSLPSRDDTTSRVTDVSRDRDRSRGDLTRDLTNDGPGKNNVDNSANSTNDKSRNDTRK
jgi:hypothetical protein